MSLNIAYFLIGVIIGILMYIIGLYISIKLIDFKYEV